MQSFESLARKWYIIKKLEGSSPKGITLEEFINTTFKAGAILLNVGQLIEAGFPINEKFSLEGTTWSLNGIYQAGRCVQFSPSETIRFCFHKDTLQPLKDQSIFKNIQNALDSAPKDLGSFYQDLAQNYSKLAEDSPSPLLALTKALNGCLEILLEGISRYQRIRIKYFSGSNEVDPYCLFFHASKIFLVARDRVADSFKFFDILEIKSADLISETFEARDVDALEIFKTDFGKQTASEALPVVEFSPLGAEAELELTPEAESEPSAMGFTLAGGFSDLEPHEASKASEASELTNSYSSIIQFLDASAKAKPEAREIQLPPEPKPTPPRETTSAAIRPVSSASSRMDVSFASGRDNRQYDVTQAGALSVPAVVIPPAAELGAEIEDVYGEIWDVMVVRKNSDGKETQRTRMEGLRTEKIRTLLKSQEILYSDLIWKKGFTDWQTVGAQDDFDRRRPLYFDTQPKPEVSQIIKVPSFPTAPTVARPPEPPELPLPTFVTSRVSSKAAVQKFPPPPAPAIPEMPIVSSPGLSTPVPEHSDEYSVTEFGRQKKKVRLILWTTIAIASLIVALSSLIQFKDTEEVKAPRVQLKKKLRNEASVQNGSATSVRVIATSSSSVFKNSSRTLNSNSIKRNLR